MKKLNVLTAFAVALLGICSIPSANAQTKMYKDGTVWNVGFIKLKPNMEVEYLNSLKTTWKATNDEAIKQGLILSYKILEGDAANPDDWGVMLMQEYKNLAAMEGNDDKWDAIRKTIIGSDDAMKATNQARVNVRDIYGTKNLREIIYK